MGKGKIKNKDKGFFAEFKKFITRGNIIDLAVGVIIGAAFSAIVTALTNKIIMPLINLIIYACTGGTGINLITVLNGKPYLVHDLEGVASVNPECIYMDWGVFIEAIINFLLIALVLFIIVKTANHIADKKKALEEKKLEEYYQKHPEERPAPAAKVPTELDVLTEIKELLKEQNANKK